MSATIKQPCIDCNGTGEKTVAGYRDNDLPADLPIEEYSVLTSDRVWNVLKRVRKAIYPGLWAIIGVVFVGLLVSFVVNDAHESNAIRAKQGYISIQSTNGHIDHCWIAHDKNAITGAVITMFVNDTSNFEKEASLLGIKDITICQRVP